MLADGDGDCVAEDDGELDGEGDALADADGDALTDGLALTAGGAEDVALGDGVALASTVDEASTLGRTFERTCRSGSPEALAPSLTDGEGSIDTEVDADADRGGDTLPLGDADALALIDDDGDGDSEEVGEVVALGVGDALASASISSRGSHNDGIPSCSDSTAAAGCAARRVDNNTENAVTATAAPRNLRAPITFP